MGDGPDPIRSIGRPSHGVPGGLLNGDAGPRLRHAARPGLPPPPGAVAGDPCGRGAGA